MTTTQTPGTTGPLPAFYVPTRPAEHPHAAAADRHGTAWMLEYRLCPPDSPLLRINAGRLLARCLPRCRSNEQLEAATCLNYLLFAFDDATLDPARRTVTVLGPRLGRLLAVLGAPEAAYGDPYQQALADLLRRLTATTSAHNLSHLISGLYQAYLYTLWDAGNQQTGTAFSLDDYISIRMSEDGFPWFAAHYPICGEYEVSHAVRRAPRVRAIEQLVGLVAGIDNDIFSFAREHGSERTLIHLLMERHDGDIGRALEHAVVLRNRLARLYTRLRDVEAERGVPGSGRYVHELGDAITGNLVWSLGTARYAAAGRAATMGLTQDPDGIDPAPLDVPAARWWWEQLT